MSIPESWEIEIRTSGNTILTIGSWGLSGIENITDYADLVRHCANHLYAFIGTEETDSADVGGAAEKDIELYF